MVERLLGERGVLARGCFPIRDGRRGEHDLAQLERQADALRGARELLDPLQSLAREPTRLVVGEEPEAKARGRDHGARRQRGVGALRRVVREIGGALRLERRVLLERQRAPMHRAAPRGRYSRVDAASDELVREAQAAVGLHQH
jgi:hypothetical protein